MTNITNEEWRPVPGFEEFYSASNLGRVRSEVRTIYYGDYRSQRVDPQKIKKVTKQNGKYWSTSLTKEGINYRYGVHRIIAWTFIGPQAEGIEVRHINGDGLDNRLENLCYGTKSDNMQDAIEHGTFSMGETHPCARFSTEDVIYMVMSDLSAKEIATEFNTSDIVIQKIRRGANRARETEEARRIKGKRVIPNKFTQLTEDQLNVVKDLSISQRKAASLLGFPQRTIWRWRGEFITD